MVGDWGRRVMQLDRDVTDRPDPTDPTEAERTGLVRSLAPTCSRSDGIGSFLVADVEQPDIVPGG